MLFPEINASGDFIDIFYHLIRDEDIKINDSKANLFCLKIENKQFNYKNLIDCLSDSIVSYCLSQREYDEMLQSRKLGQMNTKAKRKFRDYMNNKGELGELILYSFLESHLNAPKILSKMRLKTSSNDYVKGADGIHMLKLDEENFEIIFGESKMYSDITGGLRDAFDSVKELRYRESNNIYDEIELINTHIPSEFAEESYEFIKRIVKPTRDDNFDYDISFGIFVGFEININSYSSMRNIELKSTIKQDVSDLIKGRIAYINNKIKELNLDMHNFYIYLLPFDKIDETRTDIIKQLTV
ncbi:DUF1837 domain-containing protein [Paraclostridium bifermentans]|uniref:DUF1837 domain-containing protein n=1 Tax=Paraclostridium bifermentans TaxID=1490 RepID=A0AA44IGD9_PARBF|nr:DUF1837 domain-containing protein [Paraclostridium bifermentans]MBN8047279.1 DUF1837 domain-containing protein [Paraclostridium bifermentans]NME08649.1 DUF1837 domain-containing protein [Paraclostridium bifermentans]